MPLIIKNGNLLEATEQVIGHQCNCVTKGEAGGLAKKIFEKFPWADTYIGREKNCKPGYYSIHGNGADERYILNIYSQFYPGRALQPRESYDLREAWLKQAIYLLHDSPYFQLEELALPYNLGCGLAGGEWTKYEKLLADISDELSLPITLYKL